MRVYIRMLRFITHFYIKCILNCGVKTVPKNILDLRAGERKPGSRKKFTKVRSFVRRVMSRDYLHLATTP